jgi:acetyl esterase/lipase
MPLHPIAAAILDQLNAQPKLHTLSTAAARAHMIEFSKQAPPGPQVGQIIERPIPGQMGDIPLRIYIPERSGALPVLMYFHQGGWLLGNLDTDDAVCRILANLGQCIVVSVNYRHAPEHKFPAAPEDAYAATCWVAQHAHEFDGDATRLAVAGTSSGGNLAAVVTLMARAAQYPRLCYQLLRVPVTNHAFDTRSYREFGEDYGLERATGQWFWKQYLEQAQDGDHPYASPLRAADLRGLPPALIMTAGCDPLHDEGQAYAQRLIDAGVPVTYRSYAGMIHLFLGETSWQDIATHLQPALATG